MGKKKGKSQASIKDLSPKKAGAVKGGADPVNERKGIR